MENPFHNSGHNAHKVANTWDPLWPLWIVVSVVTNTCAGQKGHNEDTKRTKSQIPGASHSPIA